MENREIALRRLFIDGLDGLPAASLPYVRIEIREPDGALIGW